MLFSGWFHRSSRLASQYRPTVCVLEDRTVPAALRALPAAPPPPPPVTHFAVRMPQDVEVGKAFSVVVEADDAKNHLVPTFRGSVQVSLGTPDGGAVYPTSFTFSAADKGRHTFQMKLTATGMQTVNAVNGARTGQATISVAGPVTHFTISAPTRVQAGTSFMFTVSALDANNQIVRGYAGTVRVGSTDPYAMLPTDYKFQASDKGTHVFFVTTLNTMGIQSLTVSAPGSIFGSAQVKVFSPWIYAPYGYGGYNPYGGLSYLWY